MELVNVIGARVAREPHDLESPSSSLAQLLHAAGPPLEHRRSTQPERSYEIVRRLGRARERPGEDLRVRDEEPFFATARRVCVADELRQLRFVECAAFLDDRA